MPESPDDELFGELLSKDQYAEPSPFGEIMLNIEAAPASMQSRRDAIEALQLAVHEHTKKYKFLLTGDLNVEITWHFHERGRYESDASADIDNLLKPMLDAFCGPDGLLVDDCQIRSLGISWISTTAEQPVATVQLRFIDSEFTPKEGIAFVQLEKALCMPIDLTIPTKVQRLLYIITKYQFAMRRFGEKVLKLDYYSARVYLPVQRRFHRTRLGKFRVFTPKQYRAELRALAAAAKKNTEEQK